MPTTICNDINRLLPDLKVKALHMLKVCESKGMSVMIYETVRTKERQVWLKSTGKSKTLKSKHLPDKQGFAHAFDIVFKVKGQPSWDSSNDWARLGRIGIAEGLKWGGNFKGFYDAPHFEI